jgi:SNF2 family DNA or RNA helicase
MPFDKRDKQVRDFHDDKNPARVLIISNVGAVGLNLTISDVAIFFVSIYL